MTQTTGIDARPRPYLLVVDDDSDIRRLLQLVLDADYEVRAVGSGEAALQLLETGERFDGALVDLVMEGMDGVELARRLRAHPAAADIPIIMLTGYDDIERRRMAREVGADAYLTKPFETALLTATLSIHVPRESIFP